MAIKFNPKKSLEYELEVGDLLLLEESLISQDIYLGYSGMISKEFFSITYDQDSSRGFYSRNLFYPISKKKIKTHEGKRFEVLSVDAEKIKLKYLGKEK